MKCRSSHLIKVDIKDHYKSIYTLLVSPITVILDNQMHEGNSQMGEDHALTYSLTTCIRKLSIYVNYVNS